MNKPEDNYQLHLQVRPQEVVSISIPEDTLKSLEKAAVSRDMSVEALLKFYVGQGLRQDLTQLFSSRVLEVTTQVLAQHIESQEDIIAIIQEIKNQV